MTTHAVLRREEVTAAFDTGAGAYDRLVGVGTAGTPPDAASALPVSTAGTPPDAASAPPVSAGTR